MTQDTSKDSQLSAIRANDEKVLKLLYRENYPQVEKYVLANNGTAEEAKDIFQEAFIATWRNIQLGKFTEGSLEAYLFRIAKNKWIDYLRINKRMHKVPLTDEIPETNETAVTEELLKKIKENFRLLGDLCRDVLERFYFYRQSMQTIAGALKWTEATARNNKYRCLQQLRKSVNANNKPGE